MERRKLDDLRETYGREDTLRYFANTFIQFFQIIYSSDAAPVQYRWSDEEADRKIEIAAASTDNLKSVETKPRILVARGPMRWHNYSGIGQVQQSSSFGNHNTKHVTDLVSGSITIHCLSREDLESERLANDVVMLVRQFKQMLAANGLLTIKEFQASPTSLVKGADGGVQEYVTAVQLSLQAQDRWTIENKTNVAVKKITTIVEEVC